MPRATVAPRATCETRRKRVIDLAVRSFLSNLRRGQRSPARRATFLQPVGKQAAMWLAWRRRPLWEAI